MEVRRLKEDDYNFVKQIYQAGIDTGHATFETMAPGWEDWDRKFLPAFRLVTEENNRITGWAALSGVSDRCIYAGVCEVSCYVDPGYRGRGVGKILLQQLISLSEDNNIWTLQARILTENTASIQLHKRAGFREVGYLEKIGKLNGIWRNVLLMERRSRKF